MVGLQEEEALEIEEDSPDLQGDITLDHLVEPLAEAAWGEDVVVDQAV